MAVDSSELSDNQGDIDNQRKRKELLEREGGQLTPKNQQLLIEEVKKKIVQLTPTPDILCKELFPLENISLSSPHLTATPTTPTQFNTPTQQYSTPPTATISATLEPQPQTPLTETSSIDKIEDNRKLINLLTEHTEFVENALAEDADANIATTIDASIINHQTPQSTTDQQVSANPCQQQQG